jgi:hypothetical protein
MTSVSPWLTVIVLWNSRDAEIAAAAEELRHDLSALLGRKLAKTQRESVQAATGRRPCSNSATYCRT